MLGAGVRLTDAGLGCPDWPGCYGKLTPAHAADSIDAAVAAQGGEHGPVSMGKAWREMIHRYIASGLGLLIIALMVLAWKWRRDLPGDPWLATALVAVVILQGLFGKWTVTLLLKPAIVTGHLLGGMLTLAMLVWLWRRLAEPAQERSVVAGPPADVSSRSVQASGADQPSAGGQARIGQAGTGPLGVGHAGVRPRAAGMLRVALAAGLLALIVQIFLGGWTSTNYAALACNEFPTCQQQQWWPQADWSDAFHLTRELGQTPKAIRCRSGR